MIGRKSFLIVISNFSVQIIGWIGLVILAKLWGDFAPHALGLIGFAMAFLGIFYVIGELGFGTAHVKRISGGKDLGTCIGTYITIKIALTVLMVITIFIAIFIWKNVFHGGFYDATTEMLVYVFVLYYVFQSLSKIPLSTFTGTKEIAKREIMLLFGRFIKFPLTIIVALAGVTIVGISPAVQWPQFLQPIQKFFADHAAGSLAVTYVVGVFVAFIVGMWLLRKYPLKRPNKKYFKSYFSFAFPVMMMSLIMMLSANIDKIMIGYFWTSVEVGYYFTVQQITAVLAVFYSAIHATLFPTLSEYHSLNDFKTINKTTRLAQRYISMIMMVPKMLILFQEPEHWSLTRLCTL